ncbi:MAG: hypothetical protein KJ630_05080 [Proteobacteria bacterium]|nr:hypothetical protein [Pseudomonadota bacterium]
MQRILISLMMLSLALWGMPLQAALTKQPVLVQGQEGKPVANVTVKILKNNKVVGEEESDDMGFIYIDTSQSGLAYQLPDGTVQPIQSTGAVTAAGETESPFFSGKTPWIVGGTAAVVGVALIAGGSGGSSSGGSGTTPSTVPQLSDIAGSYSLNGSGISNPSVQIGVSGTTVTIHSTADMMGSYNVNTGEVSLSGTASNGIKESFVGRAVIENGKVVLIGTLTIGSSVYSNVRYTKI